MAQMLSVVSERFIEEDAVHLLEAYKDAYTEVCEELQKPNVLITGITGSGKSSFINALFHASIAPVGSGTPITQHFIRYAPEEIPIVLYDSKGLETGKADEFISSTKNFFKTHAKGSDGDIKNCVHVVWYIVNSAMARFQDFEKHICTALYAQVPIIFVLNKADLSTTEEREAVRDAIKSMNLENCYGIFDTVCTPGQKQSTIDLDRCPSCKTEDITISKRNRIMKCEKCGFSKSIVRRNGLSDVIKATLNLLPLLARDAFVASQKVSALAKEDQAKAIFIEYGGQFEKIHQKSTLMKETAKLLTRLSIVWQFREHGKMYGVDIAKHLIDTLTVRDSILLVLHRTSHPKYQALAIGILWNHCVRELALELLKDTMEIENYKELKSLKDKWTEIIRDAFVMLSKENLDKYANDIRKNGLLSVLEKEMPNDPEEESSGTRSLPSSPMEKRGIHSSTSLDESKEKKDRKKDIKRNPSAPAVSHKTEDDGHVPKKKKKSKKNLDNPADAKSPATKRKSKK